MKKINTIANMGVDYTWFSWFQANKKDNLDLALKHSLERIENNGVNLGMVFSARETFSVQRTA
jgi:hypothetical protein